jgi:hypothetical protein
MLQIQGQIYHRAGSLLPFPDTEPQFLQIYFVGNSNDELNRRCTIPPSARRHNYFGPVNFFPSTQ